MMTSFWSSFSHREVKAVRKLNCGASWEWALLQQWWTFTLRKLFGIISLSTSLDISPHPLLPTTTIPHHTRHVFLFLKILSTGHHPLIHLTSSCLWICDVRKKNYSLIKYGKTNIKAQFFPTFWTSLFVACINPSSLHGFGALLL